MVRKPNVTEAVVISLTRQEIESLLNFSAATRAIRQAYVSTSKGQVNIPPVGHITFPGQADCHIKYGHMQGDENFVIKIATGFPQNNARGLPNGNGVLLVLSAETGALKALLHDEMFLTDVRTGIGGALASQRLARSDSKNVLIIGTGIQARMQIDAHAKIFSHALSFTVWGRDRAKAELVASEMAGVDVSVATSLKDAAEAADIIVTTTGTNTPVLMSDWVKDGTHITAIGADAPGKQELETKLIRRANLLCVDLKSQCADHGEVATAINEHMISENDLIELGSILDDLDTPLRSLTDITIADLTGIAAQDIAIANAVLNQIQS